MATNEVHALVLIPVCWVESIGLVLGEHSIDRPVETLSPRADELPRRLALDKLRHGRHPRVELGRAARAPAAALVAELPAHDGRVVTQRQPAKRGDVTRDGAHHLLIVAARGGRGVEARAVVVRRPRRLALALAPHLIRANPAVLAPVVEQRQQQPQPALPCLLDHKVERLEHVVVEHASRRLQVRLQRPVGKSPRAHDARAERRGLVQHGAHVGAARITVGCLCQEPEDVDAEVAEGPRPLIEQRALPLDEGRFRCGEEQCKEACKEGHRSRASSAVACCGSTSATFWWLHLSWSSGSFIKVSFAFVIQFELRIRLDDFTALLLFLDRLLAWRR